MSIPPCWSELSTAGPWEPPAELIVDQCMQQVGDLRAYVNEASDLWGQVGDATPVLIDAMPPYRYYLYRSHCEEDCDRLVAPCLSPDGRQVAYVAYMEGLSGEGEGEALFLFLLIHDLPAMAGERSLIPGLSGTDVSSPGGWQ